MKKKTKKRLRKTDEGYYVGKYLFNGVKTDVYVDPDTADGSFRWPNENNPAVSPCLTIGVSRTVKGRGDGWFCFWDNLIHELVEASLYHLGHSYERTHQAGTTMDQRWFMFGHADFDEVIHRAADFLAGAFNDVTDVTRELKRRNGERGKKK